MQINVTVRDPDRREELADTIDAITTVDESLRKSYAGLDPEGIAREARRSFATTGIEMSDDDLLAYAASVSERRDFDYTLD